MDQPGLDFTEHARALRGLQRINRWSRTASILWASVTCLTRSGGTPDQPLRVLDLATGGGGTPLALARLAVRDGINLEVEGCDINPQAIRYAQREAKSHGSNARFFVLDALNDVIPPKYDGLICSLFLHHLSTAEAINLLRRMAMATRRFILVDDLIRSRWGFFLAVAGCHLLSDSRIVHTDGPTSVNAAFTLDEASALAERAGLHAATVSRHWPERFLLIWTKG
jgi:2-polyprenyl-3-methyl-5-hydroxy-6-metoxy-1,4-benzoquinol methylase